MSSFAEILQKKSDVIESLCVVLWIAFKLCVFDLLITLEITYSRDRSPDWRDCQERRNRIPLHKGGCVRRRRRSMPLLRLFKKNRNCYGLRCSSFDRSDKKSSKMRFAHRSEAKKIIISRKTNTIKYENQQRRENQIGAGRIQVGQFRLQTWRHACHLISMSQDYSTKLWHWRAITFYTNTPQYYGFSRMLCRTETLCMT